MSAFAAPQRILVTGASRGIGRAIALALCARGRQVLASGRDAAALGTLVAESERATTEARAAAGAAGVAAPAGRVVACRAELTDAADRAALIERAHAVLGGLDALVLAAGIARHSDIATLRAEDLDATLQANFVAPLLLAQRALGELADGGAIVFIGSNLAQRPVAGTLAYAASKAALEVAARTLALELAPRRIRVNLVAPGAVDTDMLRGRDHAALAAAHPLGRLGAPTEIADAVRYLLDAPWTTGSTLVVDGGALVR